MAGGEEFASRSGGLRCAGSIQQARNEVSDVTVGRVQDGAETRRGRRAAEKRWSRREASRFGERGRRVLVRLWCGCPEVFARRGRRAAVDVLVVVGGKMLVATVRRMRSQAFNLVSPGWRICNTGHARSPF
jgi:hypothetical protein